MLVVIGEVAQAVADLLGAHRLAVELRAHVLERPRTGLRPVDFAALRIKLSAILGDEADADEVDSERLRNELGVDPVFHGRAPARNVSVRDFQQDYPWRQARHPFSRSGEGGAERRMREPRRHLRRRRRSVEPRWANIAGRSPHPRPFSRTGEGRPRPRTLGVLGINNGGRPRDSRVPR